MRRRDIVNPEPDNSCGFARLPEGTNMLGAVSGKEFFDAVVPLGAVEAVFIRTKE